VVRRLVEAGIAVLGVTRAQPTLEEFYLSLVRSDAAGSSPAAVD
jgi:hypothetical protein